MEHYYTLNQKLSKIFSIALPSAAKSSFEVLSMFVSLYWIASFSKEHIIALGVSMGFMMMVFALTTIFFVGTSAQVAQYYGGRKIESLREVLGNSLVVALLASIPMCVLAFGTSEFYFDWMGEGVSGEAKRLGMEYLSICVLGIPGNIISSVCLAGLSAIGDTKRVMYVKAVVSVLHIGLNYVLIFGVEFLGIPSLEIFGAGLSLLITSYVEALILGVLIFYDKYSKNRKKPLGFNFVPNILYCKRILVVGLPSGLERFLTIFSLILIQKFMSSYGADVIAGFQIGSKIESAIFMPGFAFQVATMALVGQSLGRGRIGVAYDFIKTILVVSSVIMGILGLVICIFGAEFSKFFSQESSVITHSVYYLLAVGLSQVPLICIFCLDGALRGGGATKLSLLLQCCSIWLLRILPMSLCAYYEIDVRVIFGIIFLETYIRAGCFIAIFKYKIWEKHIRRF